MSLGVGAAISGHVDGVLNAVAVSVAAAVLLCQARPGETDAHSRELGVAQRAHERVVAAQLDVGGGLAFDRGNTLDVVLLNRAAAPLPLHPGEIDVAAGIHDRSVVQVDIPVRRRTLELTLADRNQDLGDVGGPQAVGGLHWGFRLALAALGAGDVGLKCCAHVSSRH